jgi:hypothetical protein
VRIKRSVLQRFVAACTIKARASHDRGTPESRLLEGPVWDPATSRWRVEIRYPDGSRFRKRLRRERDALRLWATEQGKLDSGTWDERAARNVTVADAMKLYREYSKVQHRSHHTYIDPSLTLWETHLGPQTPLARVRSQQVEEFKLKRAQKVSRSTTDKDLAILKPAALLATERHGQNDAREAGRRARTGGPVRIPAQVGTERR